MARLFRTLAVLATMLLTATANAQTDGYEGIIVNEIMPANIDMEIDPSFNYGGWIELYNTTNEDKVLYIYITNDPEKPFLTRISGTIKAKNYKRVWFDHNSADGVYGNNADKQVRFHMDADGGTLLFYNASGEQVFTQQYPASIARCSYCRTTDGGSTWAWTATPTPEATNNNSVYTGKRLAAPVVSTNSKLFTSSFKFTVEVPEGATLYYTTDGETPTKSHGTATTSTKEFSVSANKVYRFCLYQDGYLPSPVVTRSFIRNDKNYDLPIVSVVTKNANLYDSTIGVYCVGSNGVDGRGTGKSNKNMDWERPVNFDYIVNGEGVLSQEATFTVSGGWSRHNSISSFKLKAEKMYEGQKFFPYPLFSEKPYIKNKSFMMRNGGNDYGSRSKDATLQTVIQQSGFYVDGQSFNPCHVFINGNYLTMLNMREPSNKHFAYANYGIDTDLMDAFEMSPDSNPKLVFKAGDNKAFKEWQNLSANAADASVYDEIINKYVDIDEYINYMAVESWLGGTDWLTNNNNTKGFKAWDDGKYHFVLFDLDFAFNSTNLLSSLKGNTGNDMLKIFNNMAKNEDFKKQFVTSYCIVDGSVFTVENTQAAANYVGNLIEDALSLSNQNPWGGCNECVNGVKNSSGRNSRMNALKSFFSLGSSVNVAVNSNLSQGEIEINGMTVPTGKFDGRLYPPFTLSATAPAGFNFLGWSTGTKSTKKLFSSTSTWRYYDKGSLDGKDWKTGDVSSWSTGSAPLGYGRDGIKTTLNYGGDSNNKRPTYYFRKSFDLDEQPSSTDSFVLDFGADDGFIVYINGVEGGRYNIREGSIKYADFAIDYAPGNPDYGNLSLDPSLFRQGENTIAVEVHNNSATSSDIWWQAELTHSSSVGTEINPERVLNIKSGSGNLQYTALFEYVPEEYKEEAGRTPVMVNEISASNDVFLNEHFKKNDWIELYNTTSQAIDVAGMYLSDDKSNPTKYQIPASNDINTMIPAHGHLIIWADKLDPLSQLHTTFKLGNSDGECVVLTAADQSWSNTLEYNVHRYDESVGRYPDGGSRVFIFNHPTIEKPNFITTYSKWLYGEEKNFGVEAYIEGITVDEENGRSLEGAHYFTINGVEINAPQRGMNIIRFADGTVKKTFRK